MHILPCLAQSPDLNPFEHLGIYLDRQLSCLERKFNQTVEDAIKAKFYSID